LLAAIASRNSIESGNELSIQLLDSFSVADLVFPNKQKMCVDWIKGFTVSTVMSGITVGVVELVNEILAFIVTCKSLLS
jgi:hypothetical protein